MLLLKGNQMKLSLRKANALQNAIQEQIKTIEMTVSVSINEFQEINPTLTKARDTLVINDARRKSLLQVLYTVRAQIGTANDTVGVSQRLSQSAYIDKRLAQLKTLTDSTVSEVEVVLMGKLDKIRNRPADSRHSLYGSQDEVHTVVLTTEKVSVFKTEVAALKKEKQNLNDQVLELNVRTEIDLDQTSIDVLTSETLL